MSNVAHWMPLLASIAQHFSAAALDINEAYYVDGTVNYTSLYDGIEIQVQSYKGIIGRQTEVLSRDLHGYASLGIYNGGRFEITRYARCYSDYSCALIEYLNTTSYSRCYGAGSCSYSDHFTCDCNSEDLLGEGAFSLGNSYIYDTHQIRAEGAFTLMNSVIDSKSGGIGSLSMYLYGVGSGYNGTIICREGDICTIRCYGFACFGTIVACETNATCIIECDSSQAIYCPFIINGNYNGDMDYNLTRAYDNFFAVRLNQSHSVIVALEILLWYGNLVDIMNDYDWKCNLNTSIRFDVYDINAHDNHTNGTLSTLVIENSTKNEFNFVCCRGYRSCAPGGEPLYTSLSLISTYGTIYCAGYAACSNGYSDGIIMEGKSSNANVMCSGYDSCVETIIITRGNVTCSRVSACDGFDLYNANALFCSGSGACNNGIIYGVSNICMMSYTEDNQDMFIYSNNTQFDNARYGDNEKNVINIHFLAYRSGEDVTIYCYAAQICNIYCHVPDACDVKSTQVYCYGSCTISCHQINETEGTDFTCVNVLVSGAPTLSPTIPTGTPSVAPTILPIYISVAEKQINRFASIGIWISVIAVAMAIILVPLARWYSREHKKGGDPSSDMAIIKFFASISDLWTDVSFTVILYYQDQFVLCYISSASVIISYVLQCSIGIYFMEKWRRYGSNIGYLKKYVSKYDRLIITLTVNAGFYPTIYLLSSKLLYFNMFNLQLSQNEKNRLLSYQFFNVVLVENLTQFGVQIHYILFNSTIDLSTIVFISMFFTTLSLVSSILRETSVLCQMKNSKSLINKHDIYCNFNVEMIIKSNELESQHAFANSKIEECVDEVVKNCDLLKSDLYEKSTRYELEVFYIENRTKYNNIPEIKVYLSCKIYTFKSNLCDAFINTFYAMAIQGHSNFNLLCQYLRSILHIHGAGGPAGKAPKFEIQVKIRDTVRKYAHHLDIINIRLDAANSGPKARADIDNNGRLSPQMSAGAPPSVGYAFQAKQQRDSQGDAKMDGQLDKLRFIQAMEYAVTGKNTSNVTDNIDREAEGDTDVEDGKEIELVILYEKTFREESGSNKTQHDERRVRKGGKRKRKKNGNNNNANNNNNNNSERKTYDSDSDSTTDTDEGQVATSTNIKTQIRDNHCSEQEMEESSATQGPTRAIDGTGNTRRVNGDGKNDYNMQTVTINTTS